jgi:hypothetical protein
MGRDKIWYDYQQGNKAVSMLARPFIIIFALALTLIAWPADVAGAQTPPPTTPATGAPTQAPPDGAPAAPEGFQLIDSGRGVWLFRKNYANGSPDFVQVVDLSQEAQVKLLHGL